MFEYLSPFRIIIVTGSMRSGTTICGHMIAEDTGKEYLDDSRNAMMNLKRVRSTILEKNDVVIQSPQTAWYADEFGAQDDIAIVFVKRDISEIKESMRKRNFNPRVIKRMYDGYPPNSDMPEIIYEHWDNVQKKKILHAFEVNYHDLEKHPLWVDESMRTRENRWHGKSWKIEEIKKNHTSN